MGKRGPPKWKRKYVPQEVTVHEPPGEMMKRWRATETEHRAYMRAMAVRPRDKQVRFMVWQLQQHKPSKA